MISHTRTHARTRVCVCVLASCLNQCYVVTSIWSMLCVSMQLNKVEFIDESDEWICTNQSGPEDNITG